MKTACIYHSIDLDGWMSAAIVKHWFINGNDKVNGTGNTDLIDFIGYNYGEPIPDLSEYDRIIMCDISFPIEEMIKLQDNFKNSKLEFIWIDHHISAINTIHGALYENRYLQPLGLRDTKYAACELTWKYFFPNDPMPEIVRLLGRYDCFGHKNTSEEQTVLEFQYGARQCISDYEDAYSYLLKTERTDIGLNVLNNIWNNGKAIYQYLCTEAKQTYKNGFEIELFEPIDLTGHPELNYPKRKFICINKERFNPINFGIDYHKDGYDGAACFHYANGMWNFSLYNDNGLVDCSVIAKQFGGGGHKGAAGFKTTDISNFLIK